MVGSQGVYEDNLRHYARPSSEREAKNEGRALSDYEALYLAEMLHEWAEYLTEPDDLADVARGYVEYIRRRTSQSGGYRQVKLYAHTPKAAYVLNKAVEEWGDAQVKDDGTVATPTYHPSLIRRIKDRLEDLEEPFKEENNE